MRTTATALVSISILFLFGCAAFDAFRASPEGQAAIDASIENASAIAAMLIPPPFNTLVPALGGIIGGLIKKDPE